MRCIHSGCYWFNYYEIDPATGIAVVICENVLIEAEMCEGMVMVTDVFAVDNGKRVSFFKAGTATAKALGERIKAAAEASIDFRETVAERCEAVAA